MDELKRNFRIGRELGKGAYATVYHVTDAAGKEYAAKIMDKTRLGDKGLQQVKDEVKVLRAMNHPNVIQCKACLEDRSSLIIVMNLVKGGELSKRLAKLKHYSERTACELAKNLFQILAYIHSVGIVHRDLKPENLLLSEEQKDSAPRLPDNELTNIILADFGFAEINHGTPLKRACGTPYYIAPELLQTGVFNKMTGYIPPPCDMWSAGVVLYVLLCGFPPFRVPRDTRDAKGKLFRQIVSGKVVFDKGTSWDAVSHEAKDLVRKMLVVDPDRRLTAQQALGHPWFRSNSVPDDHLNSSLEEMNEFSAKSRLRGAVYGVESSFKMLYSNTCDRLGVRKNSRILNHFEASSKPSTALDLTNVYLGARGFEALAEAIPQHPTLEKLVLKNCLLNTDGVVKLCRYLKDPNMPSCLTHLDVSFNPITSPAGRALLVLLQSQPRLCVVGLQGTQISLPLLKKIEQQAERNKIYSMARRNTEEGSTLPPAAGSARAAAASRRSITTPASR
eukprot:TRINITY_DN1770_c0_g3_i1.p1 TRINITY_DN1770_c0_g3~~TRINITY_DN1770_c0_g3_i1.p1  ORF type:complete len:530 (+),score=174.90 TRINITY_DN1770_c0_g3_i1:77-1591(+)